MTALDRLIANGNAIIGAYKQFGSAMAGDVSFIWIHDDDTQEVITFSNIVKFQKSVTDSLEKALKEIKQVATDINIKYVNGKLWLSDNTELHYMTEEDMNNAIEQQIENLNTVAIKSAAIGAVNIKYVNGKLLNAQDVEIPIITTTKLTEILNKLTIYTKEQIKSFSIEATNLKYVDGKFLDAQGTEITIGSDGSYVEYLLKDETDTSVSYVTFNLSQTGINHNDVESLEIITTNLNSNQNTQFYLYAHNSSGNTISGYMGYTAHYTYGGGSNSSTASHNSNNNYIWFPIYNNVTDRDNGYYGHGVNMNIKIPVKAVQDGSYKNTGTITYKVSGWISGSSTYPNEEHGQWSNYSSNQGWQSDIYGFKFYPNSGSMQRGIIKVRVNLKPKRVGA